MKQLLASAVIAIAASSAHAGDTTSDPSTDLYDPTFFVGFTWAFGPGAGSGSAGPSNNLGFGIKYLTTNEPDKLAGAIGLTYFFDGSIGCDFGAAFNNGGGSLALTYDFCRSQPLFSLGAINKPDDEDETPVVAVPLSGG